MSPTLPQTVTTSADVLVQRIDEETVLLDLNAGAYYGLNGVATDMWEALAETDTVAAATDRLLRVYDVDRARLESDLAELIRELASRGLLQVPDE